MFQTANDAIEYIHSLSRFGKKAGLSNTQLMLERLGNPQHNMKFAHVAGTNGKGSVSNMLKNILMNHGYKVGYYTSPYIEFFSERICIGDEMISDDDLIYYASKVKEVSSDITPIEFEFITAMAFLYFKEKNCDITVLEVGLGGRFDATNVIDTPLVNVITSIGYDHTAILGDTLEKIAFEKAGTIKQDSVVITGQGIDDGSMAVIAARCDETHSELVVPNGEVSGVSYDPDGTKFCYKGKDYVLSLLGTFQVTNAVTAIEAAQTLKRKISLDDADIISGLSKSHWKCRFEVVSKNPVTVLDGAHNSHGIRALMESIEAYFPQKRKVFLFSMLGEKDWLESAELIAKHSDVVVVTTVPSLRKTETGALFDFFAKKGIECYIDEDYESALSFAQKITGRDDALFVFGSLYLAGAVRGKF
ncbi:MAG: bifunctional folylpolyglutamate synthase/dihydrofolate synthase [Clostridia bacterium]|nr:bifunctional folylpolyglutamate synthase/dihydrofolate synthase [Clostridia bacterium]